MKLKLVSLTVGILLSLSSFSQTDTTKTIINKDSVCLSKETAKKVVKDLLLLDAVKQENKILSDNIVSYKSELSSKDTIISIKDKQLDVYKSIMRDYKKNESLYEDNISRMYRELKWQKIKKTTFAVLFIGAVIGIIAKG